MGEMNANKKTYRYIFLVLWYAATPMILSWVCFHKLLFNLLLENVWTIFVLIYAVLVAVMDSVENEHINNTLFSTLNPNFWSKRVSWNKAKKVFGWKFDAWHIAKSLALISGGFAMVLYSTLTNLFCDLIITAYLYNITFNLFYNHIFKK